MPDAALFLKAFPFQQDVLALPVADVETSSRWYEKSFGLAETRRADAAAQIDHHAARRRRDRFAENGGDSEQDGAAILVSNIDGHGRNFRPTGWRSAMAVSTNAMA